MGFFSNQPTENRATIIAGAPTASRHMLVSPTDRHLIFFGTETTIGDTSTQDDMFIDSQIKKAQVIILLLQPIPQVLNDYLMVLKLWELFEVEMQFMFGQIQPSF
jgi:MinD superfamily P-loop ATPase